MTDAFELNNGQNGQPQQLALATAVNKEMAPLYAKMAAVMGEVGSVAREGTNNYFKYKFQRSDDVYNAVRLAMASHGIAFIANMIEVHQDATQTKQGTQITTHATFQFTLACGESGATLTSLWQAEAVDSSDKGINKVATAATKYFLLKTFLIGDPGETDPDAESPERNTQPMGGTSKRVNTDHVTPHGNGEKKADEPEAPGNVSKENLEQIAKWCEFMYDHPNHAKNSVAKLFEAGEISPDDTVSVARWKVLEHCAMSVPYRMGMPQVYEALSVAMQDEGSSVPIGSIKQWVAEGKTVEQAWQAIVAYHENKDTAPAKPKNGSQSAPAESVPEDKVPF